MVQVNTLLLLCAGFLYQIKAVSSIALDLNDLDNSKIEVVKTDEDLVVTTKIYSTPENKITEIRQGFIIVWMQDKGEYVKCVTHYEFVLTKKKLMIIELYNAFEDNILYLYKVGRHYAYTSMNKFKEIFKKNVENSENITLKRKATSYSNYKLRKSKKKRVTKLENLEPEMKDSKEPTKHTTETTKHTTETTKHTTKHTTEPIEQTQELEPEPAIELEELEPETIAVEIASDEEQDDIDLEKDLLSEPLFGEDVEKLLERELNGTGLSKNDLYSVFEEKSKEDDD